MLLLKADTQQQSDILFFVFPLKKEAKQISLSFGRLLRVKSILLDKTTWTKRSVSNKHTKKIK
jgi:hypothetical protein